jgi:pilus assembly protein CpaB
MTGRRASAFGYRLRQAGARRRRLLAAGLLAAAVAAGLQAVRPPPPPITTVLVAARDLPAGHLLVAADLAAGTWYPGAVPAGVVARPAGRVLSSAVRQGEPLTDTRLLGDGLLTGLPEDTVAIAVRLADPASALAVRAGERADVLAGPADDPLAAGPAATTRSLQGESRVVVSGALVLSLPSEGVSGESAAAGGPGLLGSLGAGSSGSSGSSGSAGSAGTAMSGASGAGVLLVAVTRADAVRLTAVSGRLPLTVALHQRLST